MSPGFRVGTRELLDPGLEARGEPSKTQGAVSPSERGEEGQGAPVDPLDDCLRQPSRVRGLVGLDPVRWLARPSATVRLTIDEYKAVYLELSLATAPAYRATASRVCSRANRVFILKLSPSRLRNRQIVSRHTVIPWAARRSCSRSITASCRSTRRSGPDGPSGFPAAVAANLVRLPVSLQNATHLGTEDTETRRDRADSCSPAPTHLTTWNRRPPVHAPSFVGLSTSCSHASRISSSPSSSA